MPGFSAAHTVIMLCVSQSGVWILAEGRNLSLLQNVQTNSATHPASYSMVSGVFLPAGKAAELLRSSLILTQYEQ